MPAAIGGLLRSYQCERVSRKTPDDGAGTRTTGPGATRRPPYPGAGCDPGAPVATGAYLVDRAEVPEIFALARIGQDVTYAPDTPADADGHRGRGHTALFRSYPSTATGLPLALVALVALAAWAATGVAQVVFLPGTGPRC